VLLSSPRVLGRLCALPFALVVAVFVLGGFGLAYSLYPFVVMDRLTLWQAASATESLAVIGIGCAVAVPAIAGYTVFAYRVFRGKASELRYA
jgi:cytochrome d ubiquinol oxidase subunit II